MTTGDALLKAILAAPEEDAPRLVYADWLQEQGREEWAGLIRKQVARSREKKRRPAPDIVAYAGRDAWNDRWEVVTSNACPKGATEAIRGCLPRPSGAGESRVSFVRGFLDALECPAEWWLTHADALTAAHPVREVTLTTYPVLSLEWVTTYRDGSTWHVAKWPGITFHLPPEPRRDHYAHWNAVTLEVRPLVAPMRFTEEMLRDMATGYNAGDAVMAAWQREMGITLPAADDEPPTV